MTTHMPTAACISLLCLVLLGAGSLAGLPTGEDARAPGVEIQVALVDAGLRHLPANQFVKGEKILVEVRLRNSPEVDRKDLANNARAVAARRALQDPTSAAEEVRESVRPKAIPLGNGQMPWSRRVEFELRGLGQRGTPPGKGSAVVPQWRPNLLRKGSPTEELRFRTVEYWELESYELSAERYKLSVRFALPGDSAQTTERLLSAEAEFGIIEPDEASATELARVGLRASQAAEKTGRYDEAIRAAEAGIRNGPAAPYDLATLYRVIGRAHEARGELEDAIAAFQQAKQVAETHFPGRTQIPTLMTVRIEELRRKKGE